MMPVRRERFSDEAHIAVLFVTLSMLHSTIQIINYYVSDGRNFSFDPREYWFPIARELSNGAVLYVSAPDNKTPLWHALNYAVYQTGYYGPIFYILIGLANAAVAYLLFRWLADAGFWRGGAIAGALYLAAVPFMGGDIINVRSFSLVFLLLAIRERNSIRRGAAVAIAVLFSQPTAVAVPVLLVDQFRQSSSGYRSAIPYCLAGMVVGGIPFVATGLLWSPEAMVVGIKMSFLGAGDYFLNHADRANPLLYPGDWARNIATASQRLAFVLLPGLAGFLATLRYRKWRHDQSTALAATLAALFFGTVLLKALSYYWMPVVVFAAALAGVAIERWINRRQPGDGAAQQ